MSIDLHESVSAGQHVARRARRRAGETVKAARAIEVHIPEIHIPEHVTRRAKKAAKKAAKRAAKKVAAVQIPEHVTRKAKKAAKKGAKKAAKRATAVAGHRAARAGKRAGKHAVRRVVVVVVVAGACGAVAVIVSKRLRDESSPLAMGTAPDPFGAAVAEADRLGGSGPGTSRSTDGEDPHQNAPAHGA